MTPDLSDPFGPLDRPEGSDAADPRWGRRWPSMRRTAIALVVVFAVLALFNVARTLWIPGDWHFAANITMWAAMVAIAGAAELNFDELGLNRSQFARGIKWGSTCALLVLVVVTIAAFIPAAAAAFDDDRANITTARLLREVVIVIPLGTVLLEEFAFRGVLFGLLRRYGRDLAAVIVSAVLFGLWHVLPTFGGTSGGLEGEASSLLGEAGLALGTFAFTTLAGVGFAWLRLRSHSLIAPVMAHIATNAVPLVVAWLLH